LAADFFTKHSEKVGMALGVPSFIIGVTIVSIGTSLPELMTSLVAVFQGNTEITVANAVGSNIANIFLITGVMALLAGTMVVRRDLIDLDLPLMAGLTALFVFIAWDQQVVLGEAILALTAYLIYAVYAVTTHRQDNGQTEVQKEKIRFSSIVIIAVSVAFIYLGAKYTIDSLIALAAMLGISASLITMSAVAVGTSLPELFVSSIAALKGKHEIAIGNIVGSNIFNIVVVVGLPALIKPLVIDNSTFLIGLPFLVGATLLYVFSGISRRIHKWEGLVYLVIYVLFIVKLFNIF